MEIIEQRVGSHAGSADRAPWLLIHSAYRDASQWEAFQVACDELEVATRALSLPGHGTSTMHKGELRHYSVRDYVRIVLAEVERAEPKPVLVGVGMGAWIVMRVAEEVALPGLALLDLPPLKGSIGRSFTTFVRHPLWSLRNVASGFEDPWRGHDAIARELLGTQAPDGRESRCVLRELFDRPVSNPEQIACPVLEFGPRAASHAAWTLASESYAAGDLADPIRCAAIAVAIRDASRTH